MHPALFDTSVYVSALRGGNDAVLASRRAGTDAVPWLSAVVLERDFDRARRILVPNLNDWAQTGRVLALMAAKYGYEQIGRGRLTNDALIAMSAARVGIRVITVNERDFRRLAEFRAFQWQVTTTLLIPNVCQVTAATE
ncbi:MAG: hypothetical protein DMG96_03195 [Acidobacteria bacterium]|nr:MAG: hypothetical protein DMG96_03195 [Acidobacteriota bacterium]